MPELIVLLKGHELRRQPIVKTQTTIGHHTDNDLVLDNVGVSRTHALLRYEAGRFVLTDIGSSNGLYVNGQLRTRHELSDGDEIMIGKFAVVFTILGGVPVEELQAVERPSISPDSSARLGPEATKHLKAVDMAKLIAPQTEYIPPLDIAPQHSSIRPPPPAPARGGSMTVLIVALAVSLVALGVLAWSLLARH